MTVYLDYNATAPLRPEARAAMLEVLGAPGNASSVHGAGQAARHRLEASRRALAAFCGAEADEVIFTSGGTEANAMALMRDVPKVITSTVEHVAVLDNCPEAERIAVDGQGVIDLEALAEAAAKVPSGSLISVMMANNETGVLQPLEAVIEIAHAHGHLVHSDAVQALGKVPIDFGGLGLDLMSVSGHKLGASTGVGALLERAGLQREGLGSFPRMRGGGQEKNRRPGTENLSGIVGFGAVAEVLVDSVFDWDIVRGWHEAFEAMILSEVPDAKVFGRGAMRLPNTTLVVMPGVLSELQVMGFDLGGICVSSGAACSSGKVSRSHVIDAMGYSDLSGFAVRVSSGWASKKEDFERLAETWFKFYKQG